MKTTATKVAAPIRRPGGHINWPAVDEMLVSAYRAGDSVHKIAKALAISYPAAQARLVMLGNAGRVEYRRRQFRPLAEHEKPIIIAEYPTCNTNELSLRLGMSRDQLNAYARSLGVNRDQAAVIEQLSIGARRKHGLSKQQSDVSKQRPNIDDDENIDYGPLVRRTQTGEIYRSGHITTHLSGRYRHCERETDDRHQYHSRVSLRSGNSGF